MGVVELPHFHLITDISTPPIDVQMIAEKHLQVHMGLRLFRILSIDVVEDEPATSPTGERLQGMMKYLVAYRNLQPLN